MKKEVAIKNLLEIVESKHSEITIYQNANELKEFYIEGEFDNDIEALRSFGDNDIFFNDDGSFPEANLYILCTTCSGDDKIYTSISEFIKDNKTLLDSNDKISLGIAKKLINNYDLDEDEQEDLKRILKENA